MTYLAYSPTARWVHVALLYQSDPLSQRLCQELRVFTLAWNIPSWSKNHQQLHSDGWVAPQMLCWACDVGQNGRGPLGLCGRCLPS